MMFDASEDPSMSQRKEKRFYFSSISSYERPISSSLSSEEVTRINKSIRLTMIIFQLYRTRSFTHLCSMLFFAPGYLLVKHTRRTFYLGFE